MTELVDNCPSMLKVQPKSIRSAGGWFHISSKSIYSDPLYNKPEDQQL